jgi:hypothetical protein
MTTPFEKFAGSRDQSTFSTRLYAGWVFGNHQIRKGIFILTQEQNIF